MRAMEVRHKKTCRRLLFVCLSTSAIMLGSGQAHAQSAPPLVSACTGVRLPRSVVTDIMAPVVTGIVTPVEGHLNGLVDLLDNIPLIGPLLPPLNVNVSGLLSNAASGQPITLQALDVNGNLVDPANGCGLQADSLTLANEGGVAIGGNQITGLGANGQAAFAGDVNAVAMGNNARAELGAIGSVAIGADSRVTAANSVAIGQGSTATRGAQLQYAALAIAGPSDSAGEFSVGAPGAERQVTNVAPGSAPTDAVNVAQLQGVATRVGAVETDVATLQGDVATVRTDVASLQGDVSTLQDRAVQYDDATHARATLAGGAGGTVLDNVADGTLAAGSREAVNGGQLFATNQNVAGNTTAITNLTTRVDNIDARVTNLTTLVNNGGGGGTPGPAQYSDATGAANGGTPSDHATLVGATAGPVTLHNVAGGNVAAGSTDAVNGGQLAATNQAVANVSARVDINTTEIANLSSTVTNVSNNVTNLASQVTTNTLAITNLTTLIGTLGGGGSITPTPVQYADAGGAPNGGIPSNDATLVGASAGPVALHNVAGGQVAAGSTDATNGGQLYAVQQDVAQVQQDVSQVQQDVVDTRQVADTALAMGQNSVQYSDSAHDSITLGDGARPVAMHNVAAGTAPTDAVNLAQLQGGMADAVNTAVGQANAYTDSRFAAFDFNLSSVRRDLNGGIAGALAAAGMPQASDPGRSMIAMGVGTYQGQQAFAFGFSTRLNDRRTVIRAGATLDTRGRAAGNAGLGFQF